MLQCIYALPPKIQVRCKSTSKIPKPILKPKIPRTDIFYNNEWHKSKSGETFTTLNPSTGEVIAEIQKSGKEDVDAAVTAARNAFEYGSPWRRMDASKRGKLMYKLADLMQKDYVLLASLESLDNGVPYIYSYLAFIKGAISAIQYYAGWADKVHGKLIPSDGNFFCYTRHEPVGVCAHIIPWNAPLLLLCSKLGPALAMGNTVVLKPSSQTTLTALHMAELYKKAGFPPGVINMASGGGDVGEILSKHPKVDKIAFTGSTRVGKLIQQYSVHPNLKRTTLELGGKSPLIIMADFNLEKAVEGAHQALFFNQGQVCMAASRTFVEAKIYDEFVAKSAARAKSRIVGDPFDLNTEHGPQIDQPQMEKVLGLINTGTKEGASLVAGGNRIGDKGFFVQPTVFANVEDHHMIAKEEIFGPVQQILKFDSLEEVLKRANSTQYGLAAGIYSNDIEKIHYLSQGLLAGSVFVNSFNVYTPQLPFGGYKNSGYGRELGEAVLSHYTEIKTVTMKIKNKST